MLDLEVDTRKLEKAINWVPNTLKHELGGEFDHIQKSFLGTFRKTRLKGPPGIRGDGRTGLFGTFVRTMLVSPTIEGMGLEIFTPSKVAKKHEFGGKVTAAGGGKLAVPLSVRTKMFTPQGKLKKKYRQPGKLRNLFEIVSRGKTFLAQKTGGEVKPLYVLKSYVILKDRLKFYATWDSMQNKVFTYLNRAVSKAINKFHSGQAWQ